MIPSDRGDLWAWYDASDTGSITSSSGDVSQINDLSGAGRHLVQSTAGNKPKTGTRTVNSLNALDFSTVSGYDVLRATVTALAQPFTVLAVVWADSMLGSVNRYFDGYDGSVGGRALFYVNGGTWRLQAGSAVNTTRAVTLGAAVQQTVIFNGSTSIFREGGVQYGGSLNPGTGRIERLNVSGDGTTIDANGSWDGLFCEMFICSSALSGSDLTDAEDYLFQKWLVAPPAPSVSGSWTVGGAVY